MFCGHCGRQLPETSRFCAYCGHPTEAGHAPQQGTAQNPYQNGYGHQPHGYCPPPPKMPGMGRAAAHTAKTAGMYKLISILTVLALLLAVLFYNQFIRSKKPEDTVAELEKALNTLDTEAMLDCFDKQTQDLYSGGLGVAGSLLDFDLNALSDLTSGLGGIMASAGLTPEFTMHVSNVDYPTKNTCMVTVDMTVSYEGATESETIQLPMKKADRKWLISLGALSDLVYDRELRNAYCL